MEASARVQHQPTEGDLHRMVAFLREMVEVQQQRAEASQPPIGVVRTVAQEALDRTAKLGAPGSILASRGGGRISGQKRPRPVQALRVVPMSRAKSSQEKLASTTCHFCGKKGHIAKECRHKDKKCWACGGSDHLVSQCKKSHCSQKGGPKKHVNNATP